MRRRQAGKREDDKYNIETGNDNVRDMCQNGLNE
jgi:hypothetical protein